MIDAVPLRILLVALAGWVNRHQLEVIAYLREENRVLKEQLAVSAARSYVRWRRWSRRTRSCAGIGNSSRGSGPLSEGEWDAPACSVRSVNWLASRRVHLMGSTPHPDEAFMGQVARMLTAADDGTGS
jgi:hypothetical protein